MKKLLLSTFLCFFVFIAYSQVQPLTAEFITRPGCNSHASLTINASGGVQPYVYSIDGKTYQQSNAFELPLYQSGAGRGYVKDSRDSVFSGVYVVSPPYEQWAYLYGTVTCGGDYKLQSIGTIVHNVTKDTLIEIQTYFPCTIGGYRETIKVLPAYNKKDTLNICAGTNFTFPDKVKLTNILKDTSHSTTFKMHNGCDSVVTYYLKVYNEQLVKYDTVCFKTSYTFEDGSIINNITKIVSHTSLVRQKDSCIAQVTTIVSIRKPDVSITENGFTLSANATNAFYQWGICSDLKNFSPLPGQTGKELIVKNAEYYAVAIRENGCKDTSECISILVTGVEDMLNESIQIYPNPVVDVATIDFSQNLGEVGVEVYNALGSKVMEKSFINSGRESLSFLNMPEGIYFVRVSGGGKMGVIQMVKN